MTVCVVGLWHLGTVAAACLAAAGHSVVGLDLDAEVVEGLRAGRAPLHEPDLDRLLQDSLAGGRLWLTTDPAQALYGADVVWITYDVPVDENDHADVDHVLNRIVRLFPRLGPGTLVLISSQVPVGTTRWLEQACEASRPGAAVTFGYSPENLRLGRAIETFTHPDRVVVGLRHDRDRQRIVELFRPFTDRVEWMSVESAEMTKHAINAFLGTSVAFINEVAVLCEHLGADAKEVERGLRTDARIGARAYVAPGAAFAGGTLARDLQYLAGLGYRTGQETPLLSAVLASNDAHQAWTRKSLQRHLGMLRGKRVAVWGLTYKPGTSTLRRSGGVALCEWLASEEALVHAHDPVVRVLPDPLAHSVRLHPTSTATLVGAEALVIATEWPEYRSLTADEVVATMATPLVLDPSRFLAQTMQADPRVRYVTVGRAGR